MPSPKRIRKQTGRTISGPVPEKAEHLHLYLPQAIRQAVIMAANGAGMSLSQWGVSAIMAALETPEVVKGHKYEPPPVRAQRKREAKQQTRSLRRAEKQDRRQRAWELFDEGHTRTEIAQQLSVNISSVSRWLATRGAPRGVRGMSAKIRHGLELIAGGMSPQDAAKACGATVEGLKRYL